MARFLPTPQIQALERTAPVLPMIPGTPGRRSFDYVRHGTIDLFAALNTATGKVIGRLSAQHRAVDFRDFPAEIDRQTGPGLAIHVICDNLSAHKAPVVHRRLLAHPRVQLHFTPTYSSWISQVERWFAELQRRWAGKTTTVECVIGLRSPDRGDIRVMGLDPQVDRKELHVIVGAQLQASALPGQLKVGEILDLYHSFYAEAADLGEIMDSLGLAEKRNAYYKSLSGGLKQRLSIALALIGNPKVAVLDEMTTGLDPQARRDTWHLIEQVRDRDVTIILVTHYMDEAERLCDRIALLDRGKVVAIDTPEGLADRAGVAKRVRFVPSGPFEDRLLAGLPGLRAGSPAGHRRHVRPRTVGIGHRPYRRRRQRNRTAHPLPIAVLCRPVDSPRGHDASPAGHRRLDTPRRRRAGPAKFDKGRVPISSVAAGNGRLRPGLRHPGRALLPVGVAAACRAPRRATRRPGLSPTAPQRASAPRLDKQRSRPGTTWPCWAARSAGASQVSRRCSNVPSGMPRISGPSTGPRAARASYQAAACPGRHEGAEAAAEAVINDAGDIAGAGQVPFGDGLGEDAGGVQAG